MTEEQYDKFCDDNHFDKPYRYKYRKEVGSLTIYAGAELRIAAEEFKKAFISILPKWMRIK